MEDDNDDTVVIEDNFYAFLNVARTATNEEISNAYRRLSRLYHPDKHIDPSRKKEAEALFNKTKRAYEVLSDPHQRAIYDSLGIRGLETEGWEIVQRSKTPQEIREEYERLAREREERRLQQRTNPKGNFTVNVNATDVFNKYEYDYDEFEDMPKKGLPSIEISGMSLSQSIEAPLTLRDTVTMSGNLATQNGNGTGSLNVSARRLLSEKGWVEFDVGVGNGPVFSLKGFRTLTKRTFGNAATIFQFTPHGIRPGLVTTLACQLDKQTVGYVNWRAGLQSAMSTMVVRDTKTSHTAVNVQFGIPHSFISLSYTHKIEEFDLKLRGCVKFGTFGSMLEYGAEKRVSEHSSLSAAVIVGVPLGVQLKIKLSRASQTYILPIHLCEEVMPSPLFYATIAPIVAWVVIKRLVVDPIVREQKERDKEKHKESYKTRMAEKKREAESAVELMRATFARIKSDEETKMGLVIVKAFYGPMISVGNMSTTAAGREAGDAGSDDDEQHDYQHIIDVMIPLQCLVKDSKLVLHEATKSQLPGFYDPCIGEDKCLLVQYLFHNHVHEVMVQDTESLRLPKNNHRVSPT